VAFLYHIAMVQSPESRLSERGMRYEAEVGNKIGSPYTQNRIVALI
jgi:hypothetical protein